MSDVAKFRDRKFRLLLYPDNPTHKAAIDRLLSPEFRALGICHDKDVWLADEEAEVVEADQVHKPGELKKPHWHFVTKHKNAVWNTALAKDLNIEPRFILPTKTFEAAALYLLHINNPEKFQYNIEDCKGTLLPELKKLIADEDENMRVLRVLDLIEREGYLSYADFIRIACKEGLYADIRRAGYLMIQVLNEHNSTACMPAVDPETGEIVAR